MIGYLFLVTQKNIFQEIIFVKEDLEVLFFIKIFGFLRKKIRIEKYFFSGPNRLP